MYTFDTNAIIYYLKGDSKVVFILQDILSQNTPVYISSITELELFSFPNLSTKETEQIEDIIRTLAVIPLDSRIARIAGYIRRKYKLNIADSVIAATTMFTGTTLITRNVRDFQKIPNFTLLKL